MCGTFVLRWNRMLKKEKNHCPFVYFLISSKIAWNSLRCVLSRLFLQEWTFSYFAKGTKIFLKSHLSWGFGCSWVSATVRKQAEGMWNCEAIWLLAHFHTGSRGQWEPPEGCWDPAPAGSIWSPPSVPGRVCSGLWTVSKSGEESSWRTRRRSLETDFCPLRIIKTPS